MFLLLFNMQVSFLLFVNVVFIYSVVFVSTFPICYKPSVHKNAYNVLIWEISLRRDKLWTGWSVFGYCAADFLKVIFPTSTVQFSWGLVYITLKSTISSLPYGIQVTNHQPSCFVKDRKGVGKAGLTQSIHWLIWTSYLINVEIRSRKNRRKQIICDKNGRVTILFSSRMPIFLSSIN